MPTNLGGSFGGFEVAESCAVRTTGTNTSQHKAKRWCARACLTSGLQVLWLQGMQQVLPYVVVQASTPRLFEYNRPPKQIPHLHLALGLKTLLMTCCDGQIALGEYFIVMA